jgi:hypothetical protein
MRYDAQEGGADEALADAFVYQLLDDGPCLAPGGRNQRKSNMVLGTFKTSKAENHTWWPWDNERIATSASMQASLSPTLQNRGTCIAQIDHLDPY